MTRYFWTSSYMYKSVIYNVVLLLVLTYRMRWSLVVQMDRKKGTSTFHPVGTFWYACITKAAYGPYSMRYDLSNSGIFKEIRLCVMEIHVKYANHTNYVSSTYVRAQNLFNDINRPDHHSQLMQMDIWTDQNVEFFELHLLVGGSIVKYDSL